MLFLALKKVQIASLNSKCPQLAETVYITNIYELIQSKSFRA